MKFRGFFFIQWKEELTLVPLCWFLCIIIWNSSSILVYLASVRGVRLYSLVSGSGLSGDIAPLCSFLLSACKCQQTGSRDHTARGHSTFTCTLVYKNTDTQIILIIIILRNISLNRFSIFPPKEFLFFFFNEKEKKMPLNYIQKFDENCLLLSNYFIRRFSNSNSQRL